VLLRDKTMSFGRNTSACYPSSSTLSPPAAPSDGMCSILRNTYTNRIHAALGILHHCKAVQSQSISIVLRNALTCKVISQQDYNHGSTFRYSALTSKPFSLIFSKTRASKECASSAEFLQIFNGACIALGGGKAEKSEGLFAVLRNT
jgi:hypothetical protein